MAPIRHATLDDVDVIVALGLRFLRETSYGRVYRENPAQLTKLATSMLDGTLDATVFLAEVDAVPVAMIGLHAYDHYLSGERSVVELFWYASPEARGSVGVRLFKAAEQWARNGGAVLLQMIAPNGAERVAGIYRAWGYQAIESAWQKRLEA